MTTTDLRVDEGYAPATGEVGVYWRSLGEGGTPLVVVPGGFGVVEAFGDVLDRLATGRRVVAVELQGHGHTADVDRPFSWDALAEQPQLTGQPARGGHREPALGVQRLDDDQG